MNGLDFPLLPILNHSIATCHGNECELHQHSTNIYILTLSYRTCICYLAALICAVQSTDFIPLSHESAAQIRRMTNKNYAGNFRWQAIAYLSRSKLRIGLKFLSSGSPWGMLLMLPLDIRRLSATWTKNIQAAFAASHENSKNRTSAVFKFCIPVDKKKVHTAKLQIKVINHSRTAETPH